MTKISSDSQTPVFVPDHLAGLDVYRTARAPRPTLLARLFPSAWFYTRLYATVSRSSRLAAQGLYDGRAWSESSWEVVRHLEGVGARIEAAGLEHLRALEGPAVFVGNHMSTLETFVLPGILRPLRPVTFVVKESLLRYPVFGAVMRSIRAIPVGRESPRQDLMTVMGDGAAKLAEGISIVIFPQTTRMVDFDPGQFNSIGAKLAARAGVPLVPLALSTHAWGQGRYLKDFGPIRPEAPVRFRFGAPLPPEAKGDAAHRAATEFIVATLAEWRRRDASAGA